MEREEGMGAGVEWVGVGVGRGLTEEQLKGTAAEKGRNRRAEFRRDSTADRQMKEKRQRWG